MRKIRSGISRDYCNDVLRLISETIGMGKQKRRLFPSQLRGAFT